VTLEQFPFVLTVFFMLLGPAKIIGPFAALTRGADVAFKRKVAVSGTLIAAALCALAALAAGILLRRYRISFDGLRISGGLVLLISALETIFRKEEHPAPASGTPTALQLAASPVAVPIIVPPAGVAAILIFTMFEREFPGVRQAVAIGLVAMMALDFLVMFFIDRVLRIPGLAIVLTVLGSVLIFMQLGLSIEMLLSGLRSLGVVRG
jgi:multiple antibiotic resistance protein